MTILLQGYDTEQVLQVLLDQYGYDVSELKYCSGVMGVPITFLDKYNPEQFELLWLASGHSGTTMPVDIRELVGFDAVMKSDMNTKGYAIIAGHQQYHRILVRRSLSGI